MAAVSGLITYEASLRMPENRLEEIVKGESRIMPPSTVEHNDLIKELARILEAELDSKRYAVLPAGYGLGIVRSPLLTYRIPDLMVFDLLLLRKARRERAKDDPYLWAVPELVVECLSPSNRKGRVKDLLADYALIAVPEVWLIEPKERTLRVFRDQEVAAQRSGTALVRSFCLPAVSVSLKRLWRAFDEGL